ncbi:uncharacterized protein LOC121422513 [Lytechinus variegatus]|uniref:uncharacterized protein LOC121422513 n=1 Tax=Lytechinus variegatus TaxID=7654 RepID=UPI001BB10A58|nr:uncharacterized protein LOC121422513 [Lytechinus variegatus]
MDSPKMWKVWHRSMKKSVIASNFDELVTKALDKLQQSRDQLLNIQLEDGTEVEADVFPYLSNSEPLHFTFATENRSPSPNFSYSSPSMSPGLPDDDFSSVDDIQHDCDYSADFSPHHSSPISTKIPNLEKPTSPIPSTSMSNLTSKDSNSSGGNQLDTKKIIKQATLNRYIPGASPPPASPPPTTSHHRDRARILSEDGRNSQYKAVNDACQAIFDKNPEILYQNGGKGKLLEMGRAEVENSYEFRKGYSQGKKQNIKSPEMRQWNVITIWFLEA